MLLGLASEEYLSKISDLTRKREVLFHDLKNTSFYPNEKTQNILKEIGFNGLIKFNVLK
jgi:hypothetical protein